MTDCYRLPDPAASPDRGYPRRRVAATALLLLAVATGCGRKDSAEEQVRAVVTAAEQAAEARDVSGVVELLAADFRDARGGDRDEARNLLRGYFIANQTVHLVTKVDSVEFPGRDVARVRATVAMAGRGADTTTAFGISASAYEFDVTLLREDGDWKVSRADWRPVSAN